MGTRRVVRSTPVLELSVRLVLALALIAILAGTLPATTVRATTMRIINVDDVDDDEAGGGCTLREAITAANLLRGPGTDPLTGCKISESGVGGPFTYTLNLPTYKYKLTGAAGEDNNAGGDLDIKRNIRLVGRGVDKTVIIGDSIDRVLHINPTGSGNYTVELEGITIRRGGVAGWGGGILLRSSVLKMSNCSLRDNAAGGGAGGGALSVNDGMVQIVNSTLTGNRADWGGAIHNAAATITVEDSTLSDNHATGGTGGAIDNSGDLTLEGCEVLSNDATDNGGGIYNDGKLRITTSTIVDNEAAMDSDGGGGGIYHTGDDISLLQVTVRDNRVTRTGDTGYPRGGGLFVSSGTVSIAQCTFMENEAHWSGGGVFLEGGTATIEATQILSNTAYVTGGLDNHYGATLVLLRSTIAHNEAESVGGLGGNGQYTIGYSSIISNTATTGDMGGMRIGGDSILTMYRSTVAYNVAARDAGGIYARDNALLRLTNCTVSGNRAGRNGGGLHNTSVGTVSRLSFVTVVGNEADSDGDGTGDGGGLYHGAGEVRIKNSLVADNFDRGGEAIDCRGTLTTEGENIVKELAGCTLAGPGLSIGGLDPLLGDLADNGGPIPAHGDGPTLTHMPRFGSPAIDRVTDCTDLDGDPVPVDQRIVVRPHFEACDIGAVEWNPNLVFLPVILR